MKTLRGTTLVEILVATGVIVASSFVLFLGFTQAGRTATRNATTEEGLHVLDTQIDIDSRSNYALFAKDGDVSEIAVSSLPNGKIVRTVTCNSAKRNGRDPNCHPIESFKTILYVLTWNGLDGTHTLRAEYELTHRGVANSDGGEIPGASPTPVPTTTPVITPTPVVTPTPVITPTPVVTPTPVETQTSFPEPPPDPVETSFP